MRVGTNLGWDGLPEQSKALGENSQGGVRQGRLSDFVTATFPPCRWLARCAAQAWSMLACTCAAALCMWCTCCFTLPITQRPLEESNATKGRGLSHLREIPQNPPLWRGRRVGAKTPITALDPNRVGLSAPAIVAARKDVINTDKPYIPPFPETYKHPTKFPSLPRKELRRKLVGTELLLPPGASRARLTMARSALLREVDRAEGGRLVRQIGAIPPELAFAANALTLGRLIPLAEASAASIEKETRVGGYAGPPWENRGRVHTLQLGDGGNTGGAGKLLEEVKALGCGTDVITKLRPALQGQCSPLPLHAPLKLPAQTLPPQPTFTSTTIRQKTPFQHALDPLRRRPLVPILLLPQLKPFRD